MSFYTGAMNTVRLESENIAPSKIVCIGRNYLEHIRELGNETPDDMVIFNKPNSSISSRLLAFHEEPLHYEGEICFMLRAGRLHALGFGLDTRTKQPEPEQWLVSFAPSEQAAVLLPIALIAEPDASEQSVAEAVKSTASPSVTVVSADGAEITTLGATLCPAKPTDCDL